MEAQLSQALTMNAMHFNKSTSEAAWQEVMVMVALKIQMFVNVINGLLSSLAWHKSLSSVSIRII